MFPRCLRDATITCYEGRVETLAERDIGRAGRREVVPQLDDPRHETLVAVTGEREVGVDRQRTRRPRSDEHLFAQHLSKASAELHIAERWDVERRVRLLEDRCDLASDLGPRDVLEQRGRVDDDRR